MLNAPLARHEPPAAPAVFGFRFSQGEANPAFPDIPPFALNTISLPFINTPRTARWVTTPQLLDNLSIVRGAHVFRGWLYQRFLSNRALRGTSRDHTISTSV